MLGTFKTTNIRMPIFFLTWNLFIFIECYYIILLQNFTAAMTSGNITLPQLGVEYHVQVSVTVADSRSSINRKSLVSSLTSNSTLFVPLQGEEYILILYIALKFVLQYTYFLEF